MHVIFQFSLWLSNYIIQEGPLFMLQFYNFWVFRFWISNGRGDFPRFPRSTVEPWLKNRTDSSLYHKLFVELWLVVVGEVVPFCNVRICNEYLRPTKYLRPTLVFMWNSALRENFNFCFSRVFCKFKVFILAGRLGPRSSFCEV